MYRSKFWILLLYAVSLLATNSVAQNGTTGNLTWNLNEGTLTISGTGAMQDYALLSFPSWGDDKGKIKHVVIEEGATNIGNSAFYECASLESVSIPATVKTVGSKAFYKCTSLKSVVIPDSVVSIGRDAFYGCTNLETLRIGKSVATIGGTFIFENNSLKTMELYCANPPEVSTKFLNETFLGAPVESCSIIVPDGSKSAYQTAKGWKKFSKIKEQSTVSQQQTAETATQQQTEETTSQQQNTAAVQQSSESNLSPLLPANYRELESKMQKYDDGSLSFTKYVLDPNLKKIVLNKYETDYQFRDGMLAVKNVETGKWGFFNEQGEKVIDFVWEYSDYGTPKFGGGACSVYKSTGKYSSQNYVIDKTGKAIALPKNANASSFCDGYAVVTETSGQFRKRYFINNKGQHVFPNLDEETYAGNDTRGTRPFKNGLAAYYNHTSGYYGYIDTTGKIVVKPQFIRAEDFSEGMAAVLLPPTEKASSRWGYINTSGEMAIEAKFSKPVLSFHDGYAAVQKTNGTVVFIDKQGNAVSPEYSDARRFCNGYAIVETVKKDMQVVNTKFEVIRKYPHDRKPLKFPSRYGPFDPFEDPIVTLDFGNYIWVKSDWSVGRICTADGQPFIIDGDYQIGSFYGKLAHAGNGIIDLEKSIQSGYAHFIILFTKPEF
jgi:hypothetical protein